MEKPRIIHIYKDYYPPVVGGIEKTINLMAEGLCDEFDIRVIVANRSSSTEDVAIRGIPVTKVASLGRIASAPLALSFPKFFREWRADIWHFHCPNPTGDLSYLKVKPQGKVVVTYHSDIVRQRWALWAYGPFLHRFLRRADVIMPTSPNYIDSSVFLKRQREKCVVVPLGIPLDQFKKSPETQKRVDSIQSKYSGKPIVLFVGKFRYYKGLQYLIPAMRHVDAHLILIGEGPMERTVRGLIEQNELKGRVSLMGEVSHDELVAHYYAADVFCLPSHLRSEALGLVQIEAMACGLPVVSCNLDTGVPFVNQNKITGLVVSAASPRALAKGLNTLLGDEKLRQKMSLQAEQRVRKMFSAEVMIQKVRDIYHELLTTYNAGSFRRARTSD